MLLIRASPPKGDDVNSAWLRAETQKAKCYTNLKKPNWTRGSKVEKEERRKRRHVLLRIDSYVATRTPCYENIVASLRG